MTVSGVLYHSTFLACSTPYIYMAFSLHGQYRVCIVQCLARRIVFLSPVSWTLSSSRRGLLVGIGAVAGGSFAARTRERRPP